MAKSQSTRNEYDRSQLSERQQRILDFIEDFLDIHGYPPTIREIGKAVEIGSTSVVNYNLNKLVREGFLERSRKVSRGLQLLQDDKTVTPRKIIIKAADNTSTFSIPLAGQIVASKPVEFFGDYEDDPVSVPAELLGKIAPDQVFALRVVGKSMIDAMVDDGDIVVLRRQEIAEEGDMVAVWLSEDNETTLKYFHHEGERIRLQPANPTMEPIFVNPAQVKIQGRVLAVMRKL